MSQLLSLPMIKDTTIFLYNYNSLNQLLEERRKSSQDSTSITVSGTIDDNTAKVFVQNKQAAVS
ncbi:MAG: hypothetical protein NC826_06640, partial [Candidatus Omnitrophica bacterium]|nr:hypothetical protein [Candidatus Omnitrophota bacterium]